jgi:hypothetical protein
MFIQWFFVKLEMFILGEAMIMDNVEEEIRGLEVWLLYLVQDLLILIVIISQMSNKLIAALNIQHLLMILVDFLCVGEVSVDN